MAGIEAKDQVVALGDARNKLTDAQSRLDAIRTEIKTLHGREQNVLGEVQTWERKISEIQGGSA
jgi:hypothetical protein